MDWGVGFPSNPKAGGLSINGSCFYSSMATIPATKHHLLTLGFILLISVEQDLQTFFFQAQVHFRRDKTESMKIMIDNGKEEIVLREFKGANAGGDAFDKYIEMKTDISFMHPTVCGLLLNTMTTANGVGGQELIIFW
ncbi:MAG: hypothetical protein IPL20_17805 [Saprospiraceae bacterium]|nr:hypothetical protein [Saprospiraceae bacterium]